MTISADTLSRRWASQLSPSPGMRPPWQGVAMDALPELIAVVGATGTGKSAFSVDLAEWLIAQGRPAEVVNADAMQLYRGMDIGTAKLSLPERRAIPHHLFDVLEVTEESTVAAYQTQARAQIENILARGATAVLVGGSGLYVSSVLYDFQFPGRDPQVRERLEAELVTEGREALYLRLTIQDPEAARAIGPHNDRRIVRALETIEVTGTSVSGTLPDAPIRWRPSAIFGLAAERSTLVRRLDARVVGMWRGGLLDEVRELIPRGIAGGVTARRAIGYAQALAQIGAQITEEDAIEQTQALTRKYARRQVSWFKRYPEVHWLSHAADPSDAVNPRG